MKYNEALSRAQNICSRQEKCTADIIKKLTDWEVHEEDINKILEQLRKDKYLDDTRYVCSFVNDKFGISKWGKVKIRYHLIQKGINEDIIKNALDEIDTDKYSDVLKDILLKKAKQIKTKSKKEKHQKLMTFAYQRGFSFDECYEIVQGIIN